MKNLELEGFGLVEMNHSELINTDGGGFFGALLGFAVGAAIGIFGDGHVYDQNGNSTNNVLMCALVGAAIGSTLPF